MIKICEMSKCEMLLCLWTNRSRIKLHLQSYCPFNNKITKLSFTSWFQKYWYKSLGGRLGGIKNTLSSKDTQKGQTNLYKQGVGGCILGFRYFLFFYQYFWWFCASCFYFRGCQTKDDSNQNIIKIMLSELKTNYSRKPMCKM